jgi:hypothetical protein
LFCLFVLLLLFFPGGIDADKNGDSGWGASHPQYLRWRSGQAF